MATVKDPVCGMDIDSEKAAATAELAGKTFYFCSPMCKTKFTQNPAKYAGAAAEQGGHAEHGHGGHHCC